MPARARYVLAAGLPVAAAAFVATAPASAHASPRAVTAATTPQTQTFHYTGGPQYFTVPHNVTQLTITADGAAGGSGGQFPINTPGGAGGRGGRVTETMTVFGGELLQLDVGGRGQDGTAISSGFGGSAAGGASNGGTGGHGDGNDTTTGAGGGGGGAASEVLIPANPVTGLEERVIAVAAGGGGGGGTGPIVLYYGGPGGAGGKPAGGGVGGTGPGAGGGGSGGVSANAYGDNGADAGTFTQGGGGGGGGGGYNPSFGGGGAGGYAGAAGAGGGGGAGGGLSFGVRTDATYSQAPSAADGAISLTYTPVTVSDALTANPNPAPPGTTVTLTDVATSSSSAGPAPTGTVTFYAKLADGTTSTLGSAALSATGANAAAAKLSTNTLPAGADGLYAVYGGDDTYFSDTSPVVTETITTGKPAATANPTAVNFGSHALGTKTTKKVTLTSTGTSPLAVGTVASSGSPFTIGANSCTGHTLAPGQACSISVIFRPTAAAKSIGHLSITDNADSSPQSVTLSGTGVG